MVSLGLRPVQVVGLALALTVVAVEALEVCRCDSRLRLEPRTRFLAACLAVPPN